MNKNRNGKGKGKGNKPNPKGKGNNKEAEEFKDESKRDWHAYNNDAAWYIPDETLRNQVGKFAFNSVIGVDSTLDQTLDDTQHRSENYIGNIMSIAMFPWIGEDYKHPTWDSTLTAINAAALKLYTQISSVNAKTTQYQPQDLALYIISVGEILSLVSHIRRILGIAMTWNPRNRTLPRQLLTACGVNPDSVLDNLATFRMKLNTILVDASNIRMIRDIKYFEKCWEIYNHVFFDKGSAMGQYYVPIPAGYLELDEEHPETGNLKWIELDVPRDNITTGYTGLVGRLENAVHKVLSSSLFNYIGTDIINYVSKQGGELLGFDYVPENFVITPEFSETFMNQIHNMDFGYANLEGYAIINDAANNTLTLASPIWYASSAEDAWNCGDSLLDFPYTDNPSVDECIDAMMYKTIIHNPKYDTEDSVWYPTTVSAPDHPVVAIYINSLVGHNSSWVKIAKNHFYCDTGKLSSTQRYHIQILDTFDIKPIFYTSMSDGLDYQGRGWIGSINFWTKVKYDQLKNLFEYSFRGLFDASVKGGKPY